MHTHRWKAAVGAPLALLSTVALIAASAPSPLPECKIAAAWASSHRAELPTTYEGLSKIDVVYRKAAYNEMSLEVHKKLWTTHLTKYLNPAEGLDAQELALVRGTIAKLDQYLDPKTGRAAMARDSLTQRVQAKFGLARAKAIFAMLGPDTPRSAPPTFKQAGMFAGAGDLLVAAAKAVGLVPVHQSPNCSCSGQSSWCGSSNHCDTGGCVQSSGCGSLWMFNCDGLCYGNQT